MTNTRSTSSAIPSSPANTSRPRQRAPKAEETTSRPLFADDEQDLAVINTALQTSTFYLGNPDLLRYVKWVETGRQQVLIANNDEDNQEPAVLEWIGEISPSNFWLYACAGWNGELGPNNNWSKASPFEKAKAKAQVRIPSQPAFAQDWQTCIANINALMTTVVTSSQDERNAYSLLHGDSIKIRHAIFEVRRMLSV